MRFLVMVGVLFAAYSYFTDTPVTELVDKDEVKEFVVETVEVVREAVE